MKKLIAYILTTALLSMASILVFSSVHALEAEEKRYITPSKHPQKVYFGDAHVHTSMSLDAAAWGSKMLPGDTYRYARGEEVTSFKGWKSSYSIGRRWLEKARKNCLFTSQMVSFGKQTKPSSAFDPSVIALRFLAKNLLFLF